MKKHMANGTSFTSHSEPSSTSARQISEPPSLAFFSSEAPTSFDTMPLSAKDDAYETLMSKGKKAVDLQQVGQTPSSPLDARQLLDPVKFNKAKAEPQNLSAKPPPLSDLGSVQVNGSGPHKRDRDESETQGMGDLIERVYNVSQREERPQKKQKAEDFEDEETKKDIYGGGGKGGEIGEYMKQKKKEGLTESGSPNPVVDLTGGESTVRFPRAKG